MKAMVGEMELITRAEVIQGASEDEDYAARSIIRSLARGLSTLGEPGGFAVAYIMKVEFGLQIEQVPYAPRRFVSVLRSMFGLGAKILEETILEEPKTSTSLDVPFSVGLTGSITADVMIRSFANVIEEELKSMTGAGARALGGQAQP
jgi:hypothetical protein